MGQVRDLFEWEISDEDIEAVRQKADINKVERSTGVIAAAKYLSGKGINPTAYLAGANADHDDGFYFLRTNWRPLAYSILAVCIAVLIFIGIGAARV